MVFAKSWEDFEIAAEAMLMENPEKCRYSMKYAHKQQSLVLKVTNNAKVSFHLFVLIYSIADLLIIVHTIQNWSHARPKEDWKVYWKCHESSHQQGLMQFILNAIYLE